MKTQVIVDKKSHQVICVFITNGKRHDFKVFKDSETHIDSETEVKTDTAYVGIEELHKKTTMPIKRKRRKKGQKEKNKLTPEEKAFNKQVSSSRILNEHVIGFIKRFNIIAERYRNRRKRFGLRMNLICGLCNYDIMGKY
jgi:hypothetical protein